ncbi:MAG: helix-turn-helix transcriptional regulator [Actinobacteria bacterium]|nr:helix-turn-helix transcriptional regulator [Actinomycetota bacterium]
MKKPHIELSINGEGAKEAVDWLARKFRLQVISSDKEEKVNIEDTGFYREMEVNRAGNLLEAARLKAGLSQKQLAEAAGVRQTMVSEFENGRRRITRAMAGRFARVLKVKTERFM